MSIVVAGQSALGHLSITPKEYKVVNLALSVSSFNMVADGVLTAL